MHYEVRESRVWGRPLRRIQRVLGPLVPAITVLVLVTLIVRQGPAPAEEAASPATERPWRLTEPLPATLGPWIGRAWEPAEPTRPMLGQVQRRARVYEHVDTGERAAVLLVRGVDRRDLRGYALPHWYTARGWQVIEERAVAWDVADQRVPAMEYEFSGPGRRGPGVPELGEVGDHVTVTSFVIGADQTLGRVLEDGRAAGPTAAGAARGGGALTLVQIAFAGDRPRQARQTAVNRLMRTIILPIKQGKGAGDQS